MGRGNKLLKKRRTDGRISRSPLVATMNRLSFSEIESEAADSQSTRTLPPWTAEQPPEDVTPLYRGTGKEAEVEQLKGDPDARRKWFGVEENRKEVVLGPKVGQLRYLP
jgi:2-methylcitrate dehydratase PrpD